METTSFFPGLIALLIAALLGFVAAWIWRSKRLAAAEKQAAKLRRERREMTAKMTQASRKFDALSKQRTKAVDALSTLKQQHQALETGHAQLAANYANLKQGKKVKEADESNSGNEASRDEEWFEGMESTSPENAGSQSPDDADRQRDSQEKRAVLEELEAFENQLSSVSDQLARDNPSAVLERQSSAVNAASDEQAAVHGDQESSGEANALRAQIAEQEAEIKRLREQMAPLLGLPLAVSTREAERDRLADVLKNKEQEILEKDKQVASKDQALADKEQEIVRKQQEIANKQQEIAGKDQKIAGKDQAVAGKEQEIADKSKAIEMKDERIEQQLQEVQSAQETIQSKQNELRDKEKTIEEKEQEISELNAALRQRSEREATLNRELETAKRADDAYREEIKRLAADKDRELLAAQQALAQARRDAERGPVKDPEEKADTANNKKVGNLSREVKNSSAAGAESKANGALPEKPNKQVDTAGVQAAPLGSTVAVDSLPARNSAQRTASVAAVDRSADNLRKARTPKKDKPAPRQFERAPSRVDNLKEIKGIGPVLERMLNRLGIYQFHQIASWSDEDIDYFDTQLADFRGRIRRDNWPSGASAAYNRKYD